MWSDEDLSELDAETALVAVALLNIADDEGWFRMHPKLVESTLFPLREFSVSFHCILKTLVNAGYLTTHAGTDGREYAQIRTFREHQRINRPTPSKIAKIIPEMSDHTQLNEDSRSTHRGKERKGKEGNRERKGTDYARARDLSQVPEIFSLWPKQTHQRQAEEAIVRSIDTGSTAEEIREGTKAIAEVVRKHGRENNRYTPGGKAFFEGERWREDPKAWEQADEQKPKNKARKRPGNPTWD